MPTSAPILLVEDNEDDVFLMRRALKKAGIQNEVYVVDDGQAAVDYLSGVGSYTDRKSFPLPAIIFLDLKLPLKSGHDVLQWIRTQEQFATLIVVVLTSSSISTDIAKSYKLGANSYLVKPPTAEQLLDLAKSFKWYWIDYNRVSEPVAN
jgi:CheY-like chemotaxis protein